MTELTLGSEADTRSLAAGLARALARLCGTEAEPFVIFLSGDLGAGKTTFVRAVLRALGVEGPVRSPTYTLMERYPLERGSALHMDLYRLGDPEELEFLGLRDEPSAGEILLVEWPEQGRRHLPAADLQVELAADGDPTAAALTDRRRVAIVAASPRGARVLDAWQPRAD